MYTFTDIAPVILTLKVTGISCVMQVIAGVPLGLLLAGKRTLLLQIIDFAITLPMIFPPMALGFFLLVILGKNGIIGAWILALFEQKLILTFWGVLIATFIVGIPFMVKSVQASRQQLDNSLIEAAAILGKHDIEILVSVVLPNITHGLTTGLLLSFGRSLGEVGISLMLGGNIISRTETLSLAIYNAVLEGDFRRATFLSVLLSGIAGCVMIMLNVIQNRNRHVSVV